MNSQYSVYWAVSCIFQVLWFNVEIFSAEMTIKAKRRTSLLTLPFERLQYFFQTVVASLKVVILNIHLRVQLILQLPPIIVTKLLSLFFNMFNLIFKKNMLTGNLYYFNLKQWYNEPEKTVLQNSSSKMSRKNSHITSLSSCKVVQSDCKRQADMKKSFASQYQFRKTSIVPRYLTR